MSSQENIYEELENTAEELVGDVLDEDYTVFRHGDSIDVFFSDETDEEYDGPWIKISYGDRGGHKNDHTFRITALDNGTQPYNDAVKGLEPNELPSDETIREMLSAAVGKVSE